MSEIDVNPLQSIGEEIKVIIRMRPLSDREKNPAFIKLSTGLRCWKILPEQNAIIQTQNDGITPVPEKISGRTIFAYDKIFNETSKTTDIYKFAAREIVSDAVQGRNGSIFAYGQTSSGKTHTMQGSSTISRNGKEDGFVHLAAVDLFHDISQSHERNYTVHASVIEVYNEEVRDLLVDTKRSKTNVLKIRENTKKGIYVNAVKKEANSLSKLLKILSSGEKNRIVAKTTLNKRSSRSHLIFCISLESKSSVKNGNSRPVSTETELSQISTLNLIDLAGSESVRHRSAHSTEKRRKEGGSINKSLLTLSRVISALGQPQSSSTRQHIGYRDSKLTRVLQPSLSGNSKLAFICCVTASGLFMEETKSTLQFAQRIKHVKTASKINIKFGDKSEIIKKLQEDLDYTKDSLSEYIDQVRSLKIENQSLKDTIKFLSGDRDRILEQIDIYEMKMKEKEVAKKRVTEGTYTGPFFMEQETTKKSNSDIRALGEANDDLKNQVGFLSGIVGQLQGKNVTSEEEQLRMNGMPANIRMDSESAIISAISEPTRYGHHIDESSKISWGEEESSASNLLSKGESIQYSPSDVFLKDYLPA